MGDREVSFGKTKVYSLSSIHLVNEYSLPFFKPEKEKQWMMARPNARNISTQRLATLFCAPCYTRLATF